jgi:substrate-binding family protein
MKNIKTALLIYLNMPSLKQTVNGLLVPVLQKADITVKQQTIEPTATDVLGPLTAGGAASADLVMPITSAPQCIQLAQGLNQLGSHAQVVASPLCFDPSVRTAAKAKIEGWYEVHIGGGTFAADDAAKQAERVIKTFGASGEANQGAFAYATYGVASALFDIMGKIGFATHT